MLNLFFEFGGFDKYKLLNLFFLITKITFNQFKF